MTLNSTGLKPSPEVILQKLIQFNTTNPPGSERECIVYIKKLLEDVGIEVNLYARDEDRPNLVARIPGKGDAPPLLLYGHMDVVTKIGQRWSHPPFEGKIHDGYIWGRGALDMKGGVAMMISTMFRLKMEEIVPAGDIIFMALSDEENNGFFGALYMVDVHSDLFDGVRYALGEFGGSNIRVAGTRFYPIQVAEKQYCSIRATVHGPGGHAATIISENAIDKTAKVLDRINNRRMPIHITPPLRIMIDEMAKGVGFPANFVLRLLLNPMLTDFLLNWFGEIGLLFYPCFIIQ